MAVDSPPRKTPRRSLTSTTPLRVHPSLVATRPDAPARILVVSLDNLGDLVFTSLLTRQLRAHFPAAHITLWCKRYTAAIGPLLPGVDEVEAAEPFWDRPPGGRSGGTLAFARSVMRLRARKFDVALLAAAPWRTAAAVAATGAARRIGALQRKNARWLTEGLAPQDIRRPVLAEMIRLLAPLGIAPTPDLYYQLDVRPLAARRDRFAALLGERVVALHPFASLRNRCVPLAQWIQTAEVLERRGYEPLWIGSRRELNEVRESAGRPGRAWRYIDELGDGSLADTAAALSLVQLFVGHDSGPLHIAGSFGVPVVGVFTPGEPARTFPQGTGQSQMLVRPSPLGVTSDDLLATIDRLTGAARLAAVAL